VFFLTAEFKRERGALTTAQLNQEGGNHEENAIEHCRVSSGIVCMGANDAAAALE
jgi:hypothetical protein